MKKFLALSLSVLSFASAVISPVVAEANTSKDEKIVIYSNAVSSGRGDYFVEEAKKAGFDIEFVELGGTDLLNRLVAEKNAPVADFIFGLNQINFQTLIAEDMLEPYAPKWLEDIDKSVEIQKDNLHSPVTIARVFPIYNEDKVNKEDLPKDWSDFYKDEKYKGLYKVQNKLGGATDTAAMYIHLINHKDDAGEMGISQEGWDNLKAWFENGYTTPEGEDWIQNFVDGKVPYAYTWMANVNTIEEEYGINVGIINPTSGVIQTVEQVAIVKDGEDNTVEQEFMEWFGSKEIMAGFAEKHNQVPVNTKAQESTPKSLMEVMESTTPAEIDFEFVSKYVDEWVEYVELNIL